MSTLIGALATAGCGATRGHGPTSGGCSSSCVHCDKSTGTCTDCTPNLNTCNGSTVVSCNADGTIGAVIKTCAGGEACAKGDCLSACGVAASTRSYIGCDYWPTTTMSGEINPYFDFAVAVANPLTVGDVVQSASANVQVFRGGDTKAIATKAVAPGAVEIITLPWVQEVAQNSVNGGGEHSALVPAGAYHLVSDLPVTVYQFSPLQFEKPMTKDCVDQPYKLCKAVKDCNPGDACVPYMGDPRTLVCQNKKTCHSYTNDASILLPTAALKTDYIVIARETYSLHQDDGLGGVFDNATPGFFTVVATDDATTVNVTYSAYTEAGTGVDAVNPGAQATYMLNKGDVLEVASKKSISPCALMSMELQGRTTYKYCDLGPKYDLTGSRISSDKPIAVFGGHSCTFIPYNKWACDHLEEQMIPLDSWGQKVIVVQTEPQIAHEPNVWRVVSGSDNNMITFDPAVHAPVTLGTGQYVEFIAEGGFLATGTGRVAVAQYMVGENYFSQNMGMSAAVGDPALGLGVNVEQMRTSYDFLTPTTYTKSYVNIVAPKGAAVMLDGNTVASDFTAIGGSGYGYKRVQMQPGAHHITADQKFSISVSGVAPYTAYLYVGGQDLNDIPVQ